MDPHLFSSAIEVELSDEVIKSETNRVLGWAVKSARDKTKDRTSSEYKLLNSMVCYEKDIEKNKLAERCDLATLLRNVGGEGGLCLVSETFFSWGQKLMRIVANQLTMKDITEKGDDALRWAKRLVHEHASLKSDFALVCKRQETRSLMDDEFDLGTPLFLYALSTNIYSAVVDKVCNAWFGEVLKTTARGTRGGEAHLPQQPLGDVLSS